MKGLGGEGANTSAESPSIRRGNGKGVKRPTKDELWSIPPPPEPSGRGLGSSVNLFNQALGGAGTVRSRVVPRDYFQKACAEMDANRAKARRGK